MHGSRIHSLLSENGEIMYLFDHFSSGVLRPEMMALPQARGTGREGGWMFARETPRGCTAAEFILCLVRRGTITCFSLSSLFRPEMMALPQVRDAGAGGREGGGRFACEALLGAG